MASGFVSWLDKVGGDVEKGAMWIVKNVLPVAAKIAEDAAPIVSLAFPLEGALLAKISSYIVTAEQKFPAPKAGESKLAYVLQLAEAELLPLAQEAGLDSAQTTAAMTTYINALVAILDGPTITAAPAKVAA